MRHGLLVITRVTAADVYALTPQEIVQGYAAEAKQADSAFTDFSADRGNDGGETSCAACHTDDARNTGKHRKTGKEIKPLAPVANAERFTDPAKVEKWFERNCQDVLERACTAAEKGDFISYLLSIK